MSLFKRVEQKPTCESTQNTLILIVINIFSEKKIDKNVEILLTIVVIHF